MGPLHGKLAVHRPTGRVGIARTRTVADGFEYSLLLADGERTEFFPGSDLKRPKREQRKEFADAKRALDLHKRTNQANTEHIGDRPVGMSNKPE